MPSAICFKLDQSKILSSGNGLNNYVVQDTLTYQISTDNVGVTGMFAMDFFYIEYDTGKIFLRQSLEFSTQDLIAVSTVDLLILNKTTFLTCPY